MKQERNALCACGSGRKHKRCCGVGQDSARTELVQLSALIQAGRHAEAEASSREWLDREPASGAAWTMLGLCLWSQGRDALPALENAARFLPHDAEAQGNLGNAYRRAGRFEDAAASHRRAIALCPEHAESHNNLGSALRDLGRDAEAVGCFGRAVAIRADFVMAHLNLARTLHDLRRLDEAAESYHRVLMLDPKQTELHRHLGNVLLDLGRAEEAVKSYRQRLVLVPNDADTHNNLGVALRQMGRHAEAEACCRRALDIQPELVAAIIFLGQLQADQGRFGEAEQSLNRAIAIQPDSPEAWAGLAGLRRMTRDDARWADEALRLAGQRWPPRREAHLRYALGKYFDDIGEFDRAFGNYRRANELTRPEGAHADAALRAAQVERILATFGHSWFAAAHRVANQSRRPVLIVGMPRSGTTLAEQILATHPAATGAGELPFWNAAGAKFAPQADVSAVSAAAIRRLADEYLQVLDGVSSEAARVVDKMPANFQHLGLIHSALPNAKIIHMRRHPADTCLSIYFHDFQTAHSYASDLEDLASCYRDYLRVMEHWRKVLPAGAMLEMSYEELIKDQEGGSRRMLEFVDLPWDPACLEFHRSARVITTFSKWQARQRISDSSVARWRHYEKYIGALRGLQHAGY